MNLRGNEVELQTALIEKMMDRAAAEYRCAPPRTIIFPKRGAAIATNKKRLSTEWTVFDPNVIGVVGGAALEQDFLFQWFQIFDLRTITEPGPTPQLNKKNLEPLIIPVPPTLEEQREIVAILDAIDRKIDLHRKKRAVLDDLFKALLHKLMTGEIRVVDLDLSGLATQRMKEPA
jgi:type I restriction enzyme, S subunit